MAAKYFLKKWAEILCFFDFLKKLTFGALKILIISVTGYFYTDSYLYS